MWEDGTRLVPAPVPVEPMEVPEFDTAISTTQAAIAQRGHRLHHHGAFVHCSRCGRHRAAQRYKYWTTVTCSGSPGQSLECSAGARSTAVRRPAISLQYDPELLVTPAKRQRLFREELAKVRASIASTRKTESTAWAAMVGALPWDPEQVEHADAPVYDVHPAHQCIVCGGYVRRTHCGSVAESGLGHLDPWDLS